MVIFLVWCAVVAYVRYEDGQDQMQWELCQLGSFMCGSSPKLFNMCGFRHTLGNGAETVALPWGTSMIRLLVFALLTLWGQEAFADWQFTRWGMTPDEVSAAARPSVIQAPKHTLFDNADRLLVMPYVAGEFAFQAEFFFSAKEPKGLYSVGLVLKSDQSCWTLESALKANYGLPDTGARLYGSPSLKMTEYWEWVQEEPNLRITLYDVAPCEVRYRPFKEPSPPKTNGL